MGKERPLSWGVLAISGGGFLLGVFALAFGVSAEMTQYTDGIWLGPADRLGISAMVTGLLGVLIPTVAGYLASATGSAIPGRQANCVKLVVIVSWVLELLSEVMLFAAVLEEARKTVMRPDGTAVDKNAASGVFAVGGFFALLAAIGAAVAYYITPKEAPRPNVEEGFALTSTGPADLVV